MDLSRYEYISFDMYDTLIKRNICKPKDIFKLVETEYNKKYHSNISNFYQLRIKSEENIRNLTRNEIKLSDIYSCMQEYYAKDVCIKLMRIEEELEVNLAQKNYNKEVTEKYNWALENKKVIIASDMYLSKQIIEKILKKNGIKYYKLYVSNEINKKKSTGEMYDYILKDLNIPSNKLLHIGDNKHSDYKMAKNRKIDAINIKNFYNNSLKERKSSNDYISENINYNMLNSFINNNIITHSNDFFSKFGYECFGPILYAFVNWIDKNLSENDKIYFLARDGKIIKKAFDLINSKNISSYYMMASRRSIIVPSLCKCKDIDDIIDKIHFSKTISIQEFLKKVGLDDYKYNEMIEKYNIVEDKKYEFENMYRENRKFFEDLYKIIINNSIEEQKNLNAYLKKINFACNVKICDIGWYGNMQNALVNITGASIEGLYLGLRPGKKKNIDAKGFLFDEDKNKEIFKKQQPFCSILEFIFSADHGSVKRFNSSKDCFELYENENAEEYEKNALKNIQNGAINFIEDFIKSNIKKYCDLNEEECSYNLFNTLYEPTAEVANKIGEIRFEDGEIAYIAHAEKLSKYLLSPTKLVKDLNKSLWKIGFLKRIIKINISYKKLYSFLKR